MKRSLWKRAQSDAHGHPARAAAPPAPPSVAPAASVDTRTRGERPRRRTPPPSPSWGSPPQWPASLDLVGLERFQGDRSCNFFLEQQAAEPPVVRGRLLPLQLLHARVPRRRLPAKAVRALPATSPDATVEPFASQQGPDLAGTRSVRFPQDLKLGGRESSADVAGRHLGVGLTGATSRSQDVHQIERRHQRTPSTLITRGRSVSSILAGRERIRTGTWQGHHPQGAQT